MYIFPIEDYDSKFFLIPEEHIRTLQQREEKIAKTLPLCYAGFFPSQGKKLPWLSPHRARYLPWLSPLRILTNFSGCESLMQLLKQL